MQTTENTSEKCVGVIPQKLREEPARNYCNLNTSWFTGSLEAIDGI